VARSPLLGEHTEQILKDVLGYSKLEIAGIRGSGAVEPLPKVAAE
jgi:formyl-CoA transferase